MAKGKRNKKLSNRALLCLVILLCLDSAKGGPVPENGGSDSNNNGPKPKKIIIPAMARKAGGRLRPEFVNGGIKETEPDMNESGHIKPPEKVEDYDDYDESDYEGSSEEQDCPRGMFYFIRWGHCVPLQCPGGRKQRNPMTGECILVYAGFSPRYYRVYGHGHGLVGSNSHARLASTVWRRTKYYPKGKTMRGG